MRCLHARVITCFHCDHSRHALFPLQASAPSTALESELRRERDELRREREVLHVPRFILIPAIGHILSSRFMMLMMMMMMMMMVMMVMKMP